MVNILLYYMTFTRFNLLKSWPYLIGRKEMISISINTKFLSPQFQESIIPWLQYYTILDITCNCMHIYTLLADLNSESWKCPKKIQINPTIWQTPPSKYLHQLKSQGPKSQICAKWYRNHLSNFTQTALLRRYVYLNLHITYTNTYLYTKHAHRIMLYGAPTSLWYISIYNIFT